MGGLAGAVPGTEHANPGNSEWMVPPPDPWQDLDNAGDVRDVGPAVGNKLKAIANQRSKRATIST